MTDGTRGRTNWGRHCLNTGVTAMILAGAGCGPHYDSYRSRPAFEEAAQLSSQGNYPASLQKYEQIMARYPTQEDRALFEMGVIHAHNGNRQSDYDRSLQCFGQIVGSHPESGYRRDSEMMMFYIENVARKDGVIAQQQGRIEALRLELREKDEAIAAQERKIATLEERVLGLVLQYGSVDSIRIEKKERRLLLLSKGEVLKVYKVALGADPVGPKERLGDNKTPEGIYRIDGKNWDSQYHLSLHLSYPNEADQRRAKEQGVAAGGDIMIHGLKNGLSWMGDFHTRRDWTKGCIAVTDEEIEEIFQLVPIGTAVEITP